MPVRMSLTFHSEALEDDLDAILSLCAHIRERGVLAGVSIRPNTPVEPLLTIWRRWMCCW